jgi:hypothetical protein
MRIRIYYLFVILLFCISAPAQSETLSNKSVIELTKAGLAPEVIFKKIAASKPAFDLSTEGLVELKRSGVDDAVISMMIEHQQALSPLVPAAETPFSTSPSKTKEAIIASARTIAFAKSSLQPSRQALEKELMKRPEFIQLNLAIERYKEASDLYVEIGYVSMSWLTHRYVYRIYDRRSGIVLAAGETTSWGSLAENLSRHIAKDLARLSANPSE